MSLEGWEEEEISIVDNDDIGNYKMLGEHQVLEHEQQNDEIPLEIIDYSCLNTFETIVQKVEMFLLNTLQTHEDLQPLWKCSNKCIYNNKSEKITTTLQENTTMASLEQQNNECNNDDFQGKTHNDSNHSSSNDSLKSCESFSSPTSLSLSKEETRKYNNNNNNSELEPIIIGKTFAINAFSSRTYYEKEFELEKNSCAELSHAVSVEIHLHDNLSPITQLYHVPFFILIKRAYVQETCNTSEAKYYLSILVTAMNNVLSSLSSMSLHRFFAPLQNAQSILQEMNSLNTVHSLSSEASLLLTSHYSWHETCVPCFTPIGPVEDGLYIGATPLCPVFCQTPSSLTPFNGNENNSVNITSRADINSKYCRSSNINHASFVSEMNKCNEEEREDRHEPKTKPHPQPQKEEEEQENLSCFGNLMMNELLAPRLCTEFSFTTHSTLPFNIFDLNVLCDVFRLHLGPQSRICIANTNSKTNCKFVTHDNTTKDNACEDACGICISVQKLYTLAMPYRFQPPHHEGSLPYMTSTASLHEEQMEFEPTPVSWNEVIRRENDRLKVICGVECYPIGTREPPITHLNVHFNWHALNERDIDELNTRTSNHDFIVDSASCDLHDDLDPFTMHINCNAWKQKSVNDNKMKLSSSSEELLENLTLHEDNNTHCKLLNKECDDDDVINSDCCTSADDKCTITLSTQVIQSDKLHHLLNDQVQDAWDDILARLQELLMHKHRSNYTTATSNTWSANKTKNNAAYKTREEVCLDDEHNTPTECMWKHLSEVDYKRLERLANELFASNPCALAAVNATGNSEINNYTAIQYDYEAEATLQRFYIDQLWSWSLQSSELEEKRWEEWCELQIWDKVRLRKGHTISASHKDIRSTYVPYSLLNRFAHLCVKHIRRAEEIFILWHLCIAQLTSLITACINTDDNCNSRCGDDNSCHDDMEKKSINANAIHNIIKMIGLPESDSPVDLTQSLLVQKLQMLTYCLRFLLHEESENSQTTFFNKEKYNTKTIFTGKGNKTSNEIDGWSDDNDDNDDDDNDKNIGNTMSKSCQNCTSADSTVNVIKNENVHTGNSSNANDIFCLITNGEAIVVPPVIPEFPHTSDALLEHALTLQNFISGKYSIRPKEEACKTDNIYGNNNDASSCLLDQEWLNHDALYNDMCLFLYVNNAHHGRVVRFADFIHWHSPRDFIWPDDKLFCKNHKNNRKAKSTCQKCEQNDEQHTYLKKEEQNEVEPFPVKCETAERPISTTLRTTKQMSKHLERKLQEETSHEQYSEIDDNLFLSERMQYHNIDNQSVHNHIWWYLWKNARPRKLEEIVHDAFNVRYELLSLCKWLHTSVEESDLLEEIEKATIANVLHPILCHRINFDKHNIIVEKTILKEHWGNEAKNAVKKSSVTEMIRFYVLQISSQINNLNKIHSFEQTQKIINVGRECERNEEDNQSQTCNTINHYKTMWKDVCKINYVLSHTLAVRCMLGEIAIFATEKTIDTTTTTSSSISTAQNNKTTQISSIAQNLSSLINYKLCDEYVAFDGCNISWKMWNNVIAPRFTKQSDKKVKNLEAEITCFAERPLKTYPCYQQMIIKYNSDSNLKITLALSREVL